MNRETASTGQLVAIVADALGQQAIRHVDLAKAEMARDARELGGDLAPAALAVPLLLLGYLLLTASLTLAISPLLGLAGACFVVGATNVAGGAAATGYTLRRLALRSVTHGN